MVKIRIIPCLDVKDGRVVKGINFLNLIDAGDPVEQAKHYSDNGADEICFLDISASLENIQALLKAGADKVSINSAAIKNPYIIKGASEYFGNQCIVVAVDAKKHNNDWFVYSHGGTKKTDLYALSWIE